MQASRISTRATFHRCDFDELTGEAGVSLPPPAFNEQGERESR